MDIAAFTDWFSAAIRLLCPERPAVVAHSLLGSFAVRFAASHGHLLRQLFVYAAPAVGPYRIPLGLLITAIRFDLRPTASNNERFEHWAFVDRERARRRDTDWFDAWRAYSLARATTPPVKRTMRQLIRAGTRQAPDQRLRNIAIPTALLWGRHDRFVPFRLAEAANARFGWPLHVIENAGHVPHIEQPDAFLTSLERALARSTPKGTTDADSQSERDVATVGRARGRI
jgi:2-hydroxymuconate-semialdehyde hydrolase